MAGFAKTRRRMGIKPGSGVSVKQAERRGGGTRKAKGRTTAKSTRRSAARRRTPARNSKGRFVKGSGGQGRTRRATASRRSERRLTAAQKRVLSGHIPGMTVIAVRREPAPAASSYYTGPTGYIRAR